MCYYCCKFQRDTIYESRDFREEFTCPPPIYRLLLTSNRKEVTLQRVKGGNLRKKHLCRSFKGRFRFKFHLNSY